MRIGPLTIRLVALLALTWAGGELVAQTGAESNYQPPQFYPPGAATASGAIQAMYFAPAVMGRANPYVDAYGNPVVVPANYCADCCEDGSGSYGYPPACDCGAPCPSCGMGGCYGGCYGGACPDCSMGTYPPFPDDVEDYSLLPPARTEQCGPHYFDVRMEAVHMTRDETFRQQIDFTSDNVNGPIVLSSSQLDFDTGCRCPRRPVRRR